MVKNKRTQQLTLHTLIVARSYWGTTVRTLLLAVLLGLGIGIHQSILLDSAVLAHQISSFIFFITMFLLLDSGYVTIARSFDDDNNLLDRAVMLACLAMYAILVILPYFVVVKYQLSVTNITITVLFILAVRLAAGMTLYQKTK